MEINGLANINMIVQMAMMENTECHTSMSPEVADKILEQLQLLERYMLSIKDGIDQVSEELEDAGALVYIPKWHEVRENPKKYPLLKERMSGTTDRTDG